MSDSAASRKIAKPTTERDAAAAQTARLLREILDYQRRLNRLARLKSSSDEHYLVQAYERQIERRRMKLAAMPRPIETAPNPWN